MTKPRKRPTSSKRKRSKITVRSSGKIRRRGSKSAKNDTLQTQMPRSNSAVFKVKLKKK